MGKRQHHHTKDVIKEFLQRDAVKTVFALLVIELSLLLFVTYKGMGMNYLPITFVLMAFTIIGCAASFHMGADRYLTVIILILLNLGFTVQIIESGDGVNLASFILKLAVLIICVSVVFCLYERMAGFLADDKTVWIIMSIQFLLCIGLCFLGEEIGNINAQGATLVISMGPVSFTPFEIVKVLYLLVISALLCKQGKTEISLGSIQISRELALVIYTMFLSVFFLICKELGTLLILCFTAIAMLWIYGKRRKWVAMLTGIGIGGFVGGWALMDQIFFPALAASGKDISSYNVIEKVISRFGSALRPEEVMFDSGYQGTKALEALSMGGLLGIETERYRLDIPMGADDMIFSNIVLTCGFAIGAMILIFYFALLKRGIEIAGACRDTYFQGVAMAITLVLIIESAVHIAYNLAIFPITGVPLYFVSQGFTAMVTAMSLAAILLVISAGSAEREG